MVTGEVDVPLVVEPAIVAVLPVVEEAIEAELAAAAATPAPISCCKKALLRTLRSGKRLVVSAAVAECPEFCSVSRASAST